VKDIPGFEGLYAITQDGQIWSYPKEWRSAKGLSAYQVHTGRWLKPSFNGRYLKASLRRKNQTQQIYIHRLVAITYLPNPFNLPEINHRDGDKFNNHVDNLEWVTRLQNAKHARRLNLYHHVPARGSNHPEAKLTENDILIIRKRWDADEVSLDTLATEYRISKSTMHSICSRKTWTHI
jgi:hypothetical protein